MRSSPNCEKMVPSVLKELFVPGSVPFLLISLLVGTILLYRKEGAAGRRLITAVVVFYWIMSTPITAVPIIRLLTPAYPPVEAKEQAHGAEAVVVLGSGVDVYRSRGDALEISTREDALRVMEAARVFRVLGNPWLVATGGLGIRRRTDAEHMALELAEMGIPADRILQERRSTNTYDHSMYVPPLLRERGVHTFVLVTSRQHIARALRVFRKAGWDPVPSTPEVWVEGPGILDSVLPSRHALVASQALIYDEAAAIYYWARGW